MSLKFYWLSFEKKFKALAALRRCHMTSSRQGVNKNMQFSSFLEGCLEVPENQKTGSESGKNGARKRLL